MKFTVLSIFIIVATVLGRESKAQSLKIGTTSFTGTSESVLLGSTASPGTLVNVLNTGWDVTAVANENVQIIAGYGNNSLPGPTGVTDRYIRVVRTTREGSCREARIKSSDGSSFKLNNIYVSRLSSINPQSVTLTGYRKGQLVQGASLTQEFTTNFVWKLYNTTAITAFEGVDELRLTTTQNNNAITTLISFDEINISAPIEFVTGEVSSETYCSGVQIAVPYSSTRQFESNNTFKVELSDATGSFSSPVTIGTLAGKALSGSINVKIPFNTASGAGYRLRVSSSSPSFTGTASYQNLTITRTTQGNSGYLADANGSQSVSIGNEVIQNFSDNFCRAIAAVTPTGSAMGTTTARVWIEGMQPSRFVKRHYEIYPQNNSASVSGSVTLYFTQAEFDDFNALNSTKLPQSASDAAGIANLKIEKRDGRSSNGDANATGLPDTYSGNTTTIDPDDSRILWVGAAGHWEVSFDVTGFSGFFIKTGNTSLPVILADFDVVKQENASMLTWRTTSEVNSGLFDIQRSADGKNWENIGRKAAAGNDNVLKSYAFKDAYPFRGQNLYRLKMVDLDGSFAYSHIRSITFDEKTAEMTAYPNPARGLVKVQVGKSYLGTKANLITITGRILNRMVIDKEILMMDLSMYTPGLYLFQTHDGKTIKVMKQ